MLSKVAHAQLLGMKILIAANTGEQFNTENSYGLCCATFSCELQNVKCAILREKAGFINQSSDLLIFSKMCLKIVQDQPLLFQQKLNLKCTDGIFILTHFAS